MQSITRFFLLVGLLATLALSSARAETLPAFGYDLFSAPGEATTEGPVIEDNYQLSPGDEVIISVWGQLNLRYPLIVDENGIITIPDEGGRVYINGLNLKELKVQVASALARIYAKYINLDNPAQSTAFVDVKLGKVRKLMVYVVGEVNKPGIYSISAGAATLINLLNNAGGIKPSGSLREIHIRRTNGATDRVDLYDLLISGQLDTKKIQINYGDYILVPLKGKSVAIQGEVKRRGLYEIIGSEGVQELVKFAGGLQPNAFLKRLQLRRYDLNEGEKILDLDGEKILAEPAANFPLQDADVLSVPANVIVRRPVVEIAGEGIKRPGQYAYKPGMTLKDLVEAAEGLREYVLLDRADMVRTQEDFSKKLTTFPLSEVYRQQKPGEYVYLGAEAKNFELKELDEIRIYSAFALRGKDKFVTLSGYVREPGTYVLADNMKLFDVIYAHGGFQDPDFVKKAYLPLAHIFRKISGQVDEKVLNFSLEKLLAADPEANLSLEAADRIAIYTYEQMAVKPSVQIEGLVQKPGTYPMAEGLTMEDLILVAGGLTPDAFKVEAVVGRTEPTGESGERTSSSFVVPIGKDFASLANEQKTRLKTYDTITVRNQEGWEPLPVVSLSGEVLFAGSYSLEQKKTRISKVIQQAGGIKRQAYAPGAILQRRKNIVELTPGGATGYEKVIIQLDQALAHPGSAADLFLQDGDRIFVPLNPGTVEVRGAVRDPGLFLYKQGKGLSYYIELAGGYARNADKGRALVHYPNGAAARKKFGNFFRPKLQAGSIIDIPVKEPKPPRARKEKAELEDKLEDNRKK